MLVLVAAGAFILPRITVWASAERSVAGDRLRTAVVERDELIRDISVQGQIVAAVAQPGLLCTNGMSNSRHSSPFANSGLVVTLGPAEYGAGV
ncbi:MAG: FAD-dependent protein, partial [Wenzhouxiangellaceae bacterium]